MILYLLAFYERCCTFVNSKLDECKTKLRVWLGPQPLNYYLLDDERVVPTTFALPGAVKQNAHLYTVETNRITQANSPAPEGRFRPLHYVAMSVEHESVGVVNLSDWIGELRANPVCELPIKQIILLWSLVHNTYIPISDGAIVRVTRNDGSEDVHRF
jgi:hypothetical protein